MGDEDEGDARGLLDALELLLHVLAQLEVQGGEGLVEKQHAGVADERPRDGDPLLLPAGQARDVPVLKALEGDHLQHLADPLLDLRLGHPLLPQGEGDVLEDVQVGEEGVPLEDGVHVPLVGRQVVYAFTHEDHVPGVRGVEAADETKQRGLSAAGGPKKSNELVVADVEADIVQHDYAVEGFCDVLQLDELGLLVHRHVLPKNKNRVCVGILCLRIVRLCARCPARGPHWLFKSLYSKEHFYYSY